MTRSVIRYILIGSFFATLAFIFINSMLPPNVSSEESGAVADFIATVFPPTTSFGAFLAEYTRKIAHFVEYGLLGTEIALYVNLYLGKLRKWAPVSLLVGFITAFIDETIQIFSGRGPSIVDIWIDVSGFTAFSLCVYLVFFIIKKLKSSRKN